MDLPGLFRFVNITAPTRIGDPNGPLAGPEIWAQALAGPTSESLLPVGPAVPHFTNGLAAAGNLAVPGLRPCDVAWVRMVAWDSRPWGMALAGVPPEWQGMTDTVPVFLGGGNSLQCAPISIPRFTQPAIVPIPEPSVLFLAVPGGALVCLTLRRRACWRRVYRA
jgi:hypothetical protein